jgi:hypothetical protein
VGKNEGTSVGRWPKSSSWAGRLEVDTRDWKLEFLRIETHLSCVVDGSNVVGDRDVDWVEYVSEDNWDAVQLVRELVPNGTVS